MKITKIETIEMRNGPQCYGNIVNWLWVRVHTDTGLIGLGETYPNSPSEKPIVLNDLAPVLLGREATDIEALWQSMRLAVHHRGWAGAELRAISAIDMALWDLLGKLTQQPVYVLLGGKCRDTVPIYNTCYDDLFDFNTHPAQLAASLYEAGIRTMKIWPFDRIGLKNRGQHLSPDELDECMEPVRKIHEAMGNKMSIAMEFHGLWNLPCAIKIAKALEPYNILWIEEMLGQDNMAAYKTLSEHMSIPLCVSERLQSRWAYRELIENGAAGVIMLDVGWTGGFTEAKKIATWADTYYRPITPHNCGGPVTHHAVWHLSTALPNLMIMETIRRHYTSFYGMAVTDPGAVVNGKLGIPSGPGLGVDFKPGFLNNEFVKIESVSAR